MPLGRGVALALAFAVAVIAAAGPVGAQIPEPPADARVRVGPLALAPVIRVTNVGHDSNVFNRDQGGNPESDFTATFSPAAEAWLRLPHVRVNGRSQFDFYYFKELSELRALDTDASARVEVPLNRLTPFVGATVTNTRHRQSLEIDAIARRRNDGVSAGADLRVASKISVGAYVTRTRLDYEPNSLYLGTDLSRVLNHKSSGEGIGVRYAVTPFTTFSVGAERNRDRFDFSPDRDSDGVVVQSSVEFSPLALVSGRASLGYRQSKFLAGGLPDFNGSVGSADLTYTLLGRTRFTIRYGRELKYSYLLEQYDYLETGFTLTVSQRLGDAWNVGGHVGRGRLAYRQEGVDPIQRFSDETVLNSGMDVAYGTGRTTVGLHVERTERHADAPTQTRGYERLRVGSTLTYVF